MWENSHALVVSINGPWVCFRETEKEGGRSGGSSTPKFLMELLFDLGDVDIKTCLIISNPKVLILIILSWYIITNIDKINDHSFNMIRIKILVQSETLVPFHRLVDTKHNLMQNKNILILIKSFSVTNIFINIKSNNIKEVIYP